MSLIPAKGAECDRLTDTPNGGRMLRQLKELGIVSEASVTSRWKVYLASDLTLTDVETARVDEPLAISDPLPSVDHHAIEATLSELFANLERLERHAAAELASSG